MSDKTEEKPTGFFGMIWNILKGVKPGTDMTEKSQSFGANMVDSRTALEVWRDTYLNFIDFLVEAAQTEDPVLKLICLTKFTLGNYRIDPTRLKKPLNPILGEQCFGKAIHDDKSETIYVAEQVSHHPPIFSVLIQNKQNKISLTPHWGKGNAAFWGTHVAIKVEGRKDLNIDSETFEMSPPPELMIRIFRGNAEYSGKSVIRSLSSGYVSSITYKEKPLIGGTWHLVSGKIFHKDSPKKILWKISGGWDTSVDFVSQTEKNKKISVDFSKIYGKWEAPSENEQSDRSSEIVWKEFKEHMTKGDTSSANKAKTEIEEAQRERKKKGEDFIPEYFEWKDKDWVWNGKLPKVYSE